MTREEAISEWTFRSNYIKKWLDEYGEEPSIRHYVELIDMAIEALHREEAEAKGWCHRIRPKNVEVVVRCKDCLNYNGNGNKCNWGMKAYDDAYCSHGHYDDGSTPILNCADGERREP